MREKYNKQEYHKPADIIKPDWDLSGAVEDLQLLFEVGKGSPMPIVSRCGMKARSSGRRVKPC